MGILNNICAFITALKGDVFCAEGDKNLFYKNLKQYLENKGLKLLAEDAFNDLYKKHKGLICGIAYYIGINETTGISISLTLEKNWSGILSSFKYYHRLEFFKNKELRFISYLFLDSGNFNFFIRNKNDALCEINNENVPKKYLSFMEDIRYFGLSEAERFIFNI